jgi:hypothetical protein
VWRIESFFSHGKLAGLAIQFDYPVILTSDDKKVGARGVQKGRDRRLVSLL